MGERLASACLVLKPTIHTRHLTEVANEELHGLYTKAPPQQCAKIHIGTHSLQCNTPTDTSALFGTPGRMFEKYDGWHLYGPDGPRLYTASVLNILSEAGITLRSSPDHWAPFSLPTYHQLDLVR